MKLLSVFRLDYAVILQELAVALHEISGEVSLLGRLLLSAGGSEKVSQISLTSSVAKKAVDDFDIRTQESNVLHARLQRLGGSRPHAGTLYIHSDEVLFGKHASQSDSIFSLPQPSSRTMGWSFLKNRPCQFPFMSNGTLSTAEYGYSKTCG